MAPASSASSSSNSDAGGGATATADIAESSSSHAIRISTSASTNGKVALPKPDLDMNPPQTPSTLNGPLMADGRRKARLMQAYGGNLRFEDVFWGTSPQDPTEGVRVLHEVFQRHLLEVEEFILCVRTRISVEEATANKFEEMANSPMLTPSTWSAASGGNTLTNRASAMLGYLSGSGSSNSGILGFFSSTPTAAAERSKAERLKKEKAAKAAAANGKRTSSETTPTTTVLFDEASTKESTDGAASIKSVADLASTKDELATTEPSPTPADIDRASIGTMISTLKLQMSAMAAVHRRHADTLTLAVLSPLTAFVDQHRRAINKKKAEVDSTRKELLRISSEIKNLKSQFFLKSRLADEEERKYKADGEAMAKFGTSAEAQMSDEAADSSLVVSLPFGNRTVGVRDLQDMMTLLKKEVPTKTILTPLGMFEGCFIGEDGMKLLATKYTGVPRLEIRAVFQELVNRRAISAAVGGVDGKFSTALPYTFGRPLLKTGEPPHVRARKDCEVARQEYAAAVASSEHTRGALEFHITDYLVSVQEAEAYRLAVCGEAAVALESAQMFAVAEVGAAWHVSKAQQVQQKAAAASEVLVDEDGNPTQPLPTAFLTVPRPSAAVQHIAERHQTGHVRTPPFVFEDPKGGRSPLQVFGIGLEELARATRKPVPQVVVQAVAALLESLETGRSNIDTWILPVHDLTSLQFLRHEMNGGGGAVTPQIGAGDDGNVEGGVIANAARGIKSSTLKRHSPSVIAGVLRLYFLEAPVSLVTHELYDPLKMLYSEEFDKFDDETRFKPITSLLETLTPPHYDTLRLFTGYLHELVKPLERSDERIVRLCWSLAPTILRPKEETAETVRDEAPMRFTKDLIVNFPDLMGDIDLHELTSSAHSSDTSLDITAGGVGLDDDEMLKAVGSRWGRRARGASLAELRASPTTSRPVSMLGSPASVINAFVKGIGAEGAEEAKASPVEGNDTSKQPAGTPPRPAAPPSGWFSWGSNGARRNTVTELTEPTKKEVADPTSSSDSVGQRLTKVINKRLSAVLLSEPKDAAIASGAKGTPASPVEQSQPKPEPVITMEPVQPKVESEAATLPVTSSPEPTTVPAIDTSAPATETYTKPTSPKPTKRSSTSAAVSSIASLASSVMFGTAYAVAAAVTKSTTVAEEPAHETEEEEDAHDAAMASIQSEEAMLASVWAEATQGEDEELEFFDGTELERGTPEADDGGVRNYLAEAGNLEEHFQFN